MKKLLVVFSFLLTSSYIHANEKGNGGDIIQCFNEDMPEHMKLLDIYEAEKKGLTVLYPEGSDEYEKVEQLISRLDELSPRRAKFYREWVQHFKENTTFVEGPLPDIQDAGIVAIPDECRLLQFAIQTQDEKGNTSYIVRRDLWEKASAFTRAHLILHEIILREARNSDKESDSVNTRKMNGVISTNNSVTTSFYEWASFLSEISFRVEYKGVFYRVSPRDDVGFELEGWGMIQVAPKLKINPRTLYISKDGLPQRALGVKLEYETSQGAIGITGFGLGGTEIVFDNQGRPELFLATESNFRVYFGKQMANGVTFLSTNVRHRQDENGETYVERSSNFDPNGIITDSKFFINPELTTLGSKKFNRYLYGELTGAQEKRKKVHHFEFNNVGEICIFGQGLLEGKSLGCY